ncbi:MAG TPA: glycosyltransferase [Gammaproteobacteria bacterium]|jgi:glycosyltransferase involved in cell wall biosynthesis|nr:glycosyltransferase [Gammaproteobacteria bacterium]
MPRLSLIIPAYNEAERLPSLLESLEPARMALGPELEVIVADNASSDATSALALAAGARVARVDKRAIAAARNGGAAIATGEILAFVDADSRVHPRALQAIASRMSDPSVVGGATGVLMERWSAGIATVYAAALPVVWLTGFDSGVVFCRRSDFTALGGYDESRLVAEDVHFLARLKRLGAQRGQRLVRLRSVKTVTSTRKFDRYGDWHYFRMAGALVWSGLRDPREFERRVRDYWYTR